MFGKTGKKNARLEEKVLDVNASMQGTISFKEPVNLRINGHFEGALDVKGNLTIGPQATVNANIKGDDITIAGKVHGDIIARVRLKLASTAQLTGNVKAALIAIDEGASFHGSCQAQSAVKHVAEVAVVAKGDDMTPEELAHFLEVDAAIVNDWANAGKIPALKDGSSWRFQRGDIEKWLVNEQIK